ncbi:MAG: NFACT RNA binding domain-containing protein [Bacilli bacterium]|nr:NFACT family protein [Bacilli bacterium]MDY4052348.1 NFACT RNA binding domain-containing protein [Bacilli bacterium]
MSMDGIFVHYLTYEFNNTILKAKINKIYQPNPLEILLQLRTSNQTFQLLISASLDSSRIYLTKQAFENPQVPGNFCMILRKYIERGIITSISQYQNDRLIIFTINTYNEMGDNADYRLIVEIMGRNSNVILINEDNKIIDSIRRVPPTENNNRYIIPKATYVFPIQNDLLNPFEVDVSYPIANYQGIAKVIQNEIMNYYDGDVKKFLENKIVPNIYTKENKQDFYCFLLSSFNSDSILTFKTLSEMLDYFYNVCKQTINYTNMDLIKQVKRLITHQNTKLANLIDDLSKAEENLKYKDLGILLQANLYMVKKGMTSINVIDFIHNGEEITIDLNPMLDASKNLKQIFNKGKKASNALIEVTNQINKTKEEIRYLNDILSMLEFATASELDEIKLDLITNSEQYKNKAKKLSSKKNNKISIQHFNYEDVTIYVGKNNIQNDYLTNKLARNNDYWFHVKDGSGAHVVVSVPNNNPSFTLSEQVIRLAASIAGYYSKYSKSSTVPIDYTKVQYIKKIPGTKGYHVTYTNQKTIYIDPDYELIKQYLRK